MVEFIFPQPKSSYSDYVIHLTSDFEVKLKLIAQEHSIEIEQVMEVFISTALNIYLDQSQPKINSKKASLIKRVEQDLKLPDPPEDLPLPEVKVVAEIQEFLETEKSKYHSKVDSMTLPKDLAYCQWVNCPNKGKKFKRVEMIKVGKLLVCSGRCALPFKDLI